MHLFPSKIAARDPTNYRYIRASGFFRRGGYETVSECPDRRRRGPSIRIASFREVVNDQRYHRLEIELLIARTRSILLIGRWYSRDVAGEGNLCNLCIPDLFIADKHAAKLFLHFIHADDGDVFRIFLMHQRFTISIISVRFISATFTRPTKNSSAKPLSNETVLIQR